MRVHRLSTTPVKATSLHHPDSVVLGPDGIEADRAFLFIDPEKPRYDSGKLAALMPVRAEHDPTAHRLRFTLPDGRTVDGDTVAGEPLTIDLWGRHIPSHRVPGPWDELASELTGRTLRLVRPDTGNVTDEEPLTLVSRASAEELSLLLGDADVGTERFRMSIDLDGAAAREEEGWTGKQVRIGTASIQILGPVPRCVVTTWDPRTGIKDLDTLKAIRQIRGRVPEGLPMGVYARVVEPGTVRVGDEAVPA